MDFITIIEISVKKGDMLSKNDPIIVLESEKAAMEVPSDFDGKIIDLKVKEGDSVREGTVFAIIEVEENEESVNEKEDFKTSSNTIAPIEDKTQRIEKASIDFSGMPYISWNFGKIGVNFDVSGLLSAPWRAGLIWTRNSLSKFVFLKPGNRNSRPFNEI